MRAKGDANRYFGRTSAQARRFYLLDAAVLAGFLIIGGTGLAISTWLALPLGDYLTWRYVHVVASVATLGLAVLKIGLHWRRIATVVARTLAELWPAPAPDVRPAPVRIGRRDFVHLMGLVGPMALLVGLHVLRSDEIVSASETEVAQPGASGPAGASFGQAAGVSGSLVESTTNGASTGESITQAVVATAPVTTAAASSGLSANPSSEAKAPAETQASSSASSACVVRCSKGCSYPGRCRRYVDTNSNKRCDLGECIA